jgi:outer membrane protein assembly factor BamB
MIYVACWAPGGDAGRRISLQSWNQALEAWDTNKDGRLSRSEVRDGEVTSRFFRMDLNQDSFLDKSEWEHHAEVFARAENVLLALKPQGRGDLTRSAVVWKYQRGIPYVASPVVHDGILWMVKDGGLVTKLTLDGRVLQQERLGATGNYFSSPVAADGKVYFASESGVASVVADQQDWKLLSSRKFGEKIYATPLAVGGRLYIRTEKALYCFRQKDSVH